MSGRTPQRNGNTTPRGDRTPRNSATTPRGGQTPSRNSSTTPRGGRTPTRNGTTTPREGRTPTRNSTTTPREGRTPSRNNMTPRANGRSPHARTPGSVSSRRSGAIVSEASSPARRFMTSPLRGLRTSEVDLSSPINYGSPLSSVDSRATGFTMRSGGSVQRNNLSVNRRQRQVDTANYENGAPRPDPDNQDVAPNLVIWGTDVVVDRCRLRFQHFIETFCVNESELPHYMTKLSNVLEMEIPYVDIDCGHLHKFDSEIYDQLICYPQEVIPVFDTVVNEVFFTKYPAADLTHVTKALQVRPFNVQKTKNMRFLNPEDMDQLITVTGMVIRCSDIIPEMRDAFFRCIVCSYTTIVEIDRGNIAEPTLCPHCNTNHCFELVHNQSNFTDKQLTKLQESPDEMPAGQTPHTVNLYSYNELIETVQAGDRVSVTGIYRAVPMQVNPRMRNFRSVYRTHIDILHFLKNNDSRISFAVEEKNKISEERIEVLRQLSKTEDIYDRLSNALAPSIYENCDIKKGILMQLFGGTRKTSIKKNHLRSEINILLCGDPGTSKSQFLSYVYDIVPRSQYTSGKGSSAVGMTAYVIKDPETRQLVLQTGALVLADNGVCCIDEFDKMSESARSVLHEVMEQQTLSIAKAGIICQLNARTSILAAANPCESQWNKNKTIIENIQLPHTLLSRFDLIFLMLDPQNEQYDRRLANHLVSLYYQNEHYERDEQMDTSLLQDYITYGRETFQPILNEESRQKLIQYYVNMRTIGSGRGQVSAYPRQLESLIRLSEAHAKMRYSNVVEMTDVDEAWRLYREALKQSATDPLSGKIDVGILTTGLSSAARQRRHDLAEYLSKVISSQPKSTIFNYQKLLSEAKSAFPFQVIREMLDDALKEVQDLGQIMVTGRTTIRRI
ncbi:DNA replication licensing factor MCM4 [Metopolophium dirhodum]|uniref:DNA replication licensing factor MCM4 n=1 Tax=Metopolophium dirhodum TaxID=44670 RepID=UPI00298F7FAD|nr:DNA replication licensing factor MCM4 [Metopolophium dirhodum]XP_060861437.1 DNA replication licensing factor MCM4 [Metopolophium dirhodum]